MKKLNLGCANDIKEGYDNIDMYCNDPRVINADVSDLSKLYELDSVDEIYARDILEHLPFKKIPQILFHWCSLLRKGGKIYIQSIDLDKQIEAYNQKIWTVEHMNTFVFAGQQCIGSEMKEIGEDVDFHKSALTQPYLIHLMKNIGMEVISRTQDELSPMLRNNPYAHNLNYKIWFQKK